MELLKLYLPDEFQEDFQIALVDDPAIESDWRAFNTDHSFKVVSDHRRIVSGYAMIANKKIPRYDEKRGYYNVEFTKESIEQIIDNFFSNQLTRNVNEMHQTGNFSDGVYLFESIQIDSERGLTAPKGFKTEADGSWFISMRVKNDEIWEKVKKGEYRGFSIENRFIEVPEKEEKLKNFIDKLEGLFRSNINKTKMKFKEIKEKIQSLAKDYNYNLEVSETEKFEEVMLLDGETKINVEPSLENPELASIEQDGEFIPIPENTELELMDGKVLVIGETAGMVVEVKEPITEEEAVEEEAMESEEPKSVKEAKRVIESVVKESVFNAEESFEALKQEYEAKFSEVEKTLSDSIKMTEFFVKENEELKIKMEELKKETEDKIKSFGKQEANEPIKSSKPIFGLDDQKYIFNK